MKLVALWPAILGVAVAATGGCTISHHSDEFACVKTADCADGRTCSDGFCVLAVDAGAKLDALACPTQCTSCSLDSKTCKIDCAVNPAACGRLITCPAGWSCNVVCSTDSACRSGIDCTTSKSCAVTCTGAQSCRNINCGAGPCNVACTGDLSCRNVVCGLSCACDISCVINSSCTSLTCRPNCDSTSVFGGCTSKSAACSTCL